MHPEYLLLKIGEVVDGPGDNTGNRVFDGVQYDYGKFHYDIIVVVAFFPFLLLT